MEQAYSKEESAAFRKKARSLVDAFDVSYDANKFRVGMNKDILQNGSSKKNKTYAVRYSVCKLENGEHWWSFNNVLEAVI